MNKFYLPFVFLTFVFHSNLARSIDSAGCIEQLRGKAHEAGLNGAAIDQVFSVAEVDESVIALDRKQPEFTTSFADYLEKRVNKRRIDSGRDMRQKHAPLLDRLTKEYGVPGHYLLAFWGLETNYGSFLGKRRAPSALVTLACDPRRADYFTSELFNLIRLVGRDGIDPISMESSWAGALGQTQFMPSTYLKYAVDGDRDGRIDLWKSTNDALASGANYLRALGWETRRRWGREVLVPEHFDWSLTGRATRKSLTEWRALGVRMSNGNLLPALDDISGAIIAPSGHRGPAFIVYHNFNIIMGWNRSESYALAVGHLADRIAGGGDLKRPAVDSQGFKISTIKQLQQQLNALGFEAGPADGILGSNTRRAVRAYQLQHSLVADGYPNPELFAHIGVL